MPARPWAVATAAAALLAAQAVPAGADSAEPVPTPTPEPTPTPTPTAAPTATPIVPGLPEVPDLGGTVIYVVTVTTTITTTTTTAPITVIAAPVTTTTTTTNNSNSSSTTSATTQSPQSAANVAASDRNGRGSLEINLRGCARKRARLDGSRTQLRLPRGTSLVLRVNGRRVGVLDLDGDRGANAKPLPLRITLRADGVLTVQRPSGRVLRIQGCSAR
ncbi:hypothetical protein C8N24_4852 [Solirubrobacter pauli]|uniref:Uncharacterized protein n=1 Tax=Solirubrobacter pauli TaxID=166793 RepID=A0A660KYR0_9ACTN|nr:hypothetical protein [Solirubrobacter pauli]RKQ86837.1 hypothetical protein C8N24_4852 [Solirubrobacter pauli]